MLNSNQNRIFTALPACAPKHQFKFKNKLYSLDATVVSPLSMAFPWAAFRRTKGGIRLPTLLDHDGYLPAFVSISRAREHQVKKDRSLSLPKGSIVVMDLGYTELCLVRPTHRPESLFRHPVAGDG